MKVYYEICPKNKKLITIFKKSEKGRNFICIYTPYVMILYDMYDVASYINLLQ